MSWNDNTYVICVSCLISFASESPNKCSVCNSYFCIRCSNALTKGGRKLENECDYCKVKKAFALLKEKQQQKVSRESVHKNKCMIL